MAKFPGEGAIPGGDDISVKIGTHLDPSGLERLLKEAQRVKAEVERNRANISVAATGYGGAKELNPYLRTAYTNIQREQKESVRLFQSRMDRQRAFSERMDALRAQEARKEAAAISSARRRFSMFGPGGIGSGTGYGQNRISQIMGAGGSALAAIELPFQRAYQGAQLFINAGQKVIGTLTGIASTAIKTGLGITALGTALGTGLAYGAYRATKAMAESEDEFRRYQVALMGVYKNEQKVNELMAAAQDIAMRKPGTFQDIAHYAVMFSMIPDIKDKLNPQTLERFSDVLQGMRVVRTDVPFAFLERGLRGFMAGKEGIRQLEMIMDVSLKNIATSVGENAEKIRNTMTPMERLNVLEKWIQSIAPSSALEAASRTWTVQIENIVDSIRLFNKTAAEGGRSGIVGEKIFGTKEGGWYGYLIMQIKDASDRLRNFVQSDLGSRWAKKVSDDMIKGIDKVLGTFRLLTSGMSAEMGLFSNVKVLGGNTWDMAQTQAEKFWNWLKGKAVGVYREISDVAEGVRVGQIDAPGWLKYIIENGSKAVGIIGSIVDKLRDIGDRGLQAIPEPFRGIIKGASDAAKSISWLAEHTVSVFNSLPEGVKSMLGYTAGAAAIGKASGLAPMAGGIASTIGGAALNQWMLRNAIKNIQNPGVPPAAGGWWKNLLLGTGTASSGLAAFGKGLFRSALVLGAFASVAYDSWRLIKAARDMDKAAGDENAAKRALIAQNRFNEQRGGLNQNQVANIKAIRKRTDLSDAQKGTLIRNIYAGAGASGLDRSMGVTGTPGIANKRESVWSIFESESKKNLDKMAGAIDKNVSATEKLTDTLQQVNESPATSGSMSNDINPLGLWKKNRWTNKWESISPEQAQAEHKRERERFALNLSWLGGYNYGYVPRQRENRIESYLTDGAGIDLSGYIRGRGAREVEGFKRRPQYSRLPELDSDWEYRLDEWARSRGIVYNEVPRSNDPPRSDNPQQRRLEMALQNENLTAGQVDRIMEKLMELGSAIGDATKTINAATRSLTE